MEEDGIIKASPFSIGKQVTISKKIEMMPEMANAKIKKLGASDKTAIPCTVEYIKVQKQNDEKKIRLKKVLWFYCWKLIVNEKEGSWHIARYNAKEKKISIKI